MLKLLVSIVVVAAGLGAAPSFAETSSGSAGGIGRGCTLNPFDHTMRCIDFDHCTKNKNGQTVCPVVVTSTRKLN